MQEVFDAAEPAPAESETAPEPPPLQAPPEPPPPPAEAGAEAEPAAPAATLPDQPLSVPPEPAPEEPEPPPPVPPRSAVETLVDQPLPPLPETPAEGILPEPPGEAEPELAGTGSEPEAEAAPEQELLAELTGPVAKLEPPPADLDLGDVPESVAGFETAPEEEPEPAEPGKATVPLEVPELDQPPTADSEMWEGQDEPASLQDAGGEAEERFAGRSEPFFDREHGGPGVESVSDELPLPTMTLARLAVDQGDLALAERTLDSLLERDPEHAGALALRDELRALRARPRGSAARIAALQGWLDAIRLAAERLSP